MNLIFRLNEFQTHNRCISENEKYGAVKAKPSLTKGDLKQKEIMDKVWYKLDICAYHFKIYTVYK